MATRDPQLRGLAPAPVDLLGGRSPGAAAGRELPGRHAAPPAPRIDEFPALQRLRPPGRRRRKIPHVPQMQWTDCGAACLAMVLHHHGREVALAEVRDAVGSGRDGADAMALLRAAGQFGLRARGLRMEVEDLPYLPPGAILHWDFNHFVVFEALERRGVRLVDPAHGHRRVTLEQFRRSFTGIALVCEPGDGFVTARAGRRPVWRYLRQLLGQRRLLVPVLVTSLLLQAFALVTPLITAALVDRVVPRADLHLLGIAGLGVAVVLGFQLLTQLVRSHLLLQLRTSLDLRIMLGFLEHLVNLPWGFFQRRSAGDLLMRVNSNGTIRELLTTGTVSALLDGSLVLAYLVMMLLVSPRMGLLVVALGAAQVLLFLLSRARLRGLAAEALETQARAQSYLVQLVAGIETLKLSGAEMRAVERWSHLFVDDLNVALARGRIAGLVDAVMAMLRSGAPALILAQGTLLVVRGELTLGTMLALSALGTGFLGPLASLVQKGLELQLLGGYLERVQDVLTSPREQPEPRPAAPRLRGQVVVEDAWFRHAETAPYVVRGVSLHIPAGSFVALVGRSGSGKSSLAGLLLGLHPASAGRIRFDGIPLEQLDLRSMRRQLGVVPQHPYIFGATVRDNIALSDPRIPLEAVQEAAEQACIAADIDALPMGYDTLVSDGGASLSGGQRQRIAVARALVHRPALVLLDEATSALDAATEAAVMRNLARLRCTRIVIAHRLSTVRSADCIAVMEHGQVVELGAHDELVARGGLYCELVAAQAGPAAVRRSAAREGAW